MPSELQVRVKALQEQLAAAIAEQELEAARVPGEEAERAEEAGRDTRSQDEEEEVAMRARGVQLEGSVEGAGERPAMDGAF